MRFSHVFLTRPRSESAELAAMLAPLGLQLIVQPAFDFRELDAAATQPAMMAALKSGELAPLLIFTSPRAVRFGLGQLPGGLTRRVKVAAIGPATARALEAAGVTVTVRPSSGYTSEALLDTLQADSAGFNSPDRSALIMAAPGGRRKLAEGLASRNWATQMLMVYERKNASINKQELGKLQEADKIISVWTSANAMKSLSQRLPPASWFRLCQGEWLVISKRLKRLARAYGPDDIHLSSGPGNSDLFTAIRTLVL
jgi:uroporphyrinogen-III synthase